jgi:hypothetical protein
VSWAAITAVVRPHRWLAVGEHPPVEATAAFLHSFHNLHFINSFNIRYIFVPRICGDNT